MGQTENSGRATGKSALPSRTDIVSPACQVRKVQAAVSTRTLRPAIEDYFDPARWDEKPLFRQRMHMYQRIPTPASSLTENDVETGCVRIIGAREDERLPTPISTHPSIRWKVFCSVI